MYKQKFYRITLCCLKKMRAKIFLDKEIKFYRISLNMIIKD